MKEAKLTIVIETTHDGFKVTVPGLVIEKKCTLHQSREARDEISSLLHEALMELKGLKIV